MYLGLNLSNFVTKREKKRTRTLSNISSINDSSDDDDSQVFVSTFLHLEMFGHSKKHYFKCADTSIRPARGPNSARTY